MKPNLNLLQWSCEFFSHAPNPNNFIIILFPTPLKPPSYLPPSYLPLAFPFSIDHFLSFSCILLLFITLFFHVLVFFLFPFVLCFLSLFFIVFSFHVCVKEEEFYSNKNFLGHIGFLLLVSHRGKRFNNNKRCWLVEMWIVCVGYNGEEWASVCCLNK